MNHKNVEVIFNAETKELIGEDKSVHGLVYEDKTTGERKTLAVQGVFVEIGAVPNSELVKELANVNEYGRIMVDQRTQQTSAQGIWAAGDVTDGLYQQNNISAGDALKAILNIYEGLYVRGGAQNDYNFVPMLQLGYMRMLNKYLLLGSVALLVAIFFISMFLWMVVMEKPTYTAVLLKTGDLYFGTLQRFPSFGLQHPYILQINKDNLQNPVSVQSFKSAIWGPEDFININRNEVVWTAGVRSDSNLAKYLDVSKNLPDVPPVAQPTAPQATSSLVAPK